MFKILIFLAFLQILTEPISSMIYSVDDKLENCNNGSKPFLDISTIKLEIVGDTETIANGKWIVLKTIDSVWTTGFYGERYDRGEWNLMFRKRADNFCNDINDPTQLWNLEFKKIMKGKGCPYEKGLEVEFKNYTLDLKHFIIPPHWTGRWRLTLYGSLINSPGYYQCNRFYGDVYDN